MGSGRLHLAEPHHDGSSRYVSTASPGLGEKVTVRIRIPAAWAVTEVFVRSTADGEPSFRVATEVPGPDTDYSAGDRWWAAQVEVTNPVTRYRFLLGRPGQSPVWLTGVGVSEHDVSDAADFRLVSHPAPPRWSANTVVYQIFLDRFERSAAAADRERPDWASPCDWDTTEVIGRGPETPRQFYGGDLDGIVDRLAHLEHLGVDTVYLTPIFPANSNHRYDATSFDRVDPLLGGDAALDRLANALHDKGMRLVGDLTTNHCGSGHSWFVAAQEPAAPERAMFTFDAVGGYTSWLGVPSLPKLNWAAPLTRERMSGVVRRWLGPLDGWRIDVANMTGRQGGQDLNHEVAQFVREQATEARPDALVVAEYMHDYTADLDTGGWHATMNYAGFTKPVWTWLRGDDPGADQFMEVPTRRYTRTGGQAVATMRAFSGSVSWQAMLHSWLPLSSHDSARIRTVVGSFERHVIAAGLQLTLPGQPLIFAGDEFGLTGWNGESSRTPMPWHRPADRDDRMLPVYRELIALRRSEPALGGGLRWAYVDDDALVFLRESAAGAVLVSARRAAGAPIVLPGIGDGIALYGGADLAGGIVPSGGPGFWMWRLA